MRHLFYAALLALAVPCACLAQPTQISRTCASSGVTAVAPDAMLLDLMCQTIFDHTDRLAACGIEQRRPIRITAVPKIEGLPPNCVGAFHCASDQLMVVLPETLIARDAPEFIYHGLAPTAAFASILRHELTHALLEHMTEDAPLSPAGHEYIANAFQLDAMTEAERATFFDTNGKHTAKSLDSFNMLVYALAPGRFASAAWQHFSAPENGCDFVQDLLSGTVVLGIPHGLP